MTHEYTPTDNGIAHYAARGMDDMGICAYDEAKRRWSRWLAAHDAEVRDNALTLTDSELAIAEGAYESSIMEYEDDGLEAMSIALSAVADDRRNNEHRNG